MTYETYRKMKGVEEVYSGLLKIGFSPYASEEILKDALQSLAWQDDEEGDIDVWNLALALTQREKNEVVK